jgi:hypothetical protein
MPAHRKAQKDINWEACSLYHSAELGVAAHVFRPIAGARKSEGAVTHQ